MSALDDASILDYHSIEDSPHGIGVMGRGSRSGVTFSWYTVVIEKNAARSCREIFFYCKSY